MLPFALQRSEPRHVLRVLVAPRMSRCFRSMSVEGVLSNDKHSIDNR
jgi:hypothetical protein